MTGLEKPRGFGKRGQIELARTRPECKLLPCETVLPEVVFFVKVPTQSPLSNSPQGHGAMAPFRPPLSPS